jgi:hypothetical protein
MGSGDGGRADTKSYAGGVEDGGGWEEQGRWGQLGPAREIRTRPGLGAELQRVEPGT